MSSGFNFGQASTGFSFGAPKPAAAAPSTGFGMTSAMPAATGGGFAFGSAPTQATPNPAGSFSFGTPAKSTPAGGGFSFGTPTAPFGMVTPQPAAAAAAPPQGLTMGTAVAPSPMSGFAMTTAAPAGGGFAFGAPPQALPQQPAVQLQPAAPPTATVMATPAAGVPSFGGFGFGSTKVQATTAAPVAAPIAAPGGGFSFGTAAPSNLTMGMQPQPALAAALATQATITSAPAPVATVAAAITGVPTAFTLGLKPLTGMSIPTTSTATTLSTTAAPPVMTYAQLEGLINKWSLELEDQERHFLQQATQVNAWDRMLVENGEKITSLHKEMEKVKLDQRRLNQELDFILSQQKELEDLLCPLEESVKEQSGTIYMQNADEERERTYKLAENVDAQLKRMSQDLKEIIEHLNTSSGPADTSDPLQQICKILNTHMDSLQWIDQNSVLLQRRVEEVSKLCDNQRKDQEKTFRLTFD
ncbi:Nuclear pore glycoprotein p62 [Liparis tanakae]|uniref:Nuclear pore glycoprotein p62 n=1 Tax=Liparis tanakae TaxID=230148 RepID=A0A4Z2GZQ7_9TELE|nr:Nuclear pore glycoprotein p62 [Liparis tanakae]